MDDSTIVKMGYAIQNYLEKSGIKSAKPAELMEPLIELGFFEKDQSKGLPLRNILRDLNKANKLYLLPQVKKELKTQNIWWSFEPLKF
ncbi:hypothetical protein B4Q04_09620 [Zobellia sp. OII3]|uniref:hypothetical protein n=1 Tax=Zobellia sp. OII3 TaxID=2034520 RepID=UPI000B538379|nr:hypothetical protein [Zobellia sp. OII3]OWW25840.1 hypothetical protein B4Q04_09620 [Zobellia sp. OII3]